MYVLKRPPQTDDELYELVYTLWGVKIPREPVCPDHATPFQAFADAFFARAPVAVWKASRGLGGKSRTLAYLTLTEAVVLGADANLLGGSGAQSQNVHEAMRDGWNFPLAPSHMLLTDNMNEMRLTNTAKVKALMASQRSVRGPHPQRLRLDEIDEMDVEILDAALGQPMPTQEVDSQVVMSSTHQYPDKTMSEILHRANMTGWPVYEWSVAQGSMVTTAQGERPIEDVRPSDYVWTRAGWKPVQHVSLMGRQPTLAISLSNGRTLRVTPDHKVATARGWVRAENLRSGDALSGFLMVGSAHDAVSPVVAGGDVRVLRGVLMPPWAVGSCDLCGDVGSHDHVLPMTDQPEMVGTNARTLSAQMVDLLVLGDVANEYAPGESVGALLPGSAVDDAVAVPGERTAPEPALAGARGSGSDVVGVVDDATGVGAVGAGLASPGGGVDPDRVGLAVDAVHVESIRTGAVVPVYDIGVYDEHEFLVEGVIVHNCWKETSNDVDGWLPKSHIQKVRETVTQRMWEIEYDLQEPTIGSRAFDTEKVEEMFVGYRADPSLPPDDDPGLATYKHHDVERGEQYEFEPPDLRRGEYVTGADWAKEQDWTVIATFRTDCDPWRLVAYSRTRRKPYPLMVKLFNKRLARFPGGAIHDATGLGNVIADYLDERVKNFIMSGRDRDDMLTEYINAVEKGALVAPKIETAYSEHKYASVEDIYGRGKDNHLPDTVCAMALCWHMRNRITRGVTPALDLEHEGGGSPWRLG